jgi:hypothetical protein
MTVWKCRECKYFKPGDDAFGQCIRYVPKPFSDLAKGRHVIGIWPLVDGEFDYCGEHSWKDK